MTLVASFRLRDIPILIGDFLLTDNQKNVPNNFLPTVPHLRKTTAAPTKSRIAGTRKKIHRINDRLVVGFTGNLTPGKALMRALASEFGHKNPTRAELETFLSKIAIWDKNKTQLVGWIWEKRPLCFKWSGTSPDRISIEDAIFAGSGGEHFAREIMRSDTSMFGHGFRTELERAVYMSVANVGKVLCAELSKATNLDHAYGFGSEVIYWDGNRFQYVDTIAFHFWNIRIEKDNRFFISPSNVSTIYKNFDTFSVMQVSHIGIKSTGPGLEAKNTYVDLITPLNDDMMGYDVSKIGRLPVQASFWFTGISVYNPLKSLHAFIPHVSDGSDGSITTYRNGILSFDTGQLNDLLPRQFFND